MKIINLFLFFSFFIGLSNPINNNISFPKSVPECTVTVSVTPISCTTKGIPSNDGSIKVTASAASGSTTIEWTSNTASTLIPNVWEQNSLMAGAYTIEVFHNGAFVYKQTHTIAAPNSLDASFKKTDNLCYQGNEGSITISANGGTPPYQYSINNGLQYSTSATFEDLPKGDYEVIVMDAKGCMISEAVKISQGAFLSVSHPPSIEVAACLGQTAIDAAFNSWLSEFKYYGGTKPLKESFSHDPIPSPCGGSITVTYTVEDNCGVEKTCNAIFTVPQKNDFTITTEAQSMTVSCESDPEMVFQQWLANNGNATANSNCDVAWTNNYLPELWDNSCENSKNITVTFTASNGCENLETIALFSIEDITAPELSDTPEDITVSCNNIPETALITATDNCDTSVSVLFEEKTTTNGCSSILERVWTATDCAGNTTSHTQTLTIEDIEVPNFVEALPQDQTMYCTTLPDAVVLTAVDQCDQNVVVTMKESTSEEDCTQIITRVWTAVDCSGNVGSHTQVITLIQDNEPPILTEISQEQFQTEITTNCANIPEVPELEFADQCNSELNIEFEETSTYVNNQTDYQIQRIWTVTDPCENQATFAQTIEVSQYNTEQELVQIMLCQRDAVFDLNELISPAGDFSGHWTLAQENSYLNGSFFDPTTAELGVYTAYYTLEDSCTPQSVITITLHDDCVVLPCDSTQSIAISKAITPNGDAYNEFFTIGGLEDCGFKLELQVFNRWGNKIYESMDYQNNWNAFSNSSNSQFMPAGTYYYIVTIADSGFDAIKGYVYVGTTAK